MMAWIELKIDLKRTADSLGRIADALDRAIPNFSAPKPAKPAVFINTDPEKIAEAEFEADRKREAGTEGAV